MARRKNDFYPTPTNLTLALLDGCPIKGYIYEPCNGKGAISKVLAKHFGVDHMVTGDIDPEMQPEFLGDAKTQWPEPVLYGNFDWVITNPPFKGAEAIWKNCYEHCDNVAFLLRLSFLEPVKKREWLSKNPPNKIYVLPRTSFTEDGKTDSVTCAWMVWNKGSLYDDIRVYTKQQLKELEEIYNAKW